MRATTGFVASSSLLLVACATGRADEATCQPRMSQKLTLESPRWIDSTGLELEISYHAPSKVDPVFRVSYSNRSKRDLWVTIHNYLSFRFYGMGDGDRVQRLQCSGRGTGPPSIGDSVRIGPGGTHTRLETVPCRWFPDEGPWGVSVTYDNSDQATPVLPSDSRWFQGTVTSETTQFSFSSLEHYCKVLGECEPPVLDSTR